MIKSILILIILLIPSSVYAQSSEHHEWWNHGIMFASGVAAAADLSTTSWAIGKDPNKFVEGNWFLKWASDDPVKLAVAKMTVDGAIIYIAFKNHKKHPKKVFILMAAKTAFSAIIAHNNAKKVGLR